MCKQYLPRKPKGTKLKAQIKPQERPVSKISKAFVTGKEIRKKIFEKLMKGGSSGSQKKPIRLSIFLGANDKHQIKGYFSQQHVTCSICYDVMVAPVLVQCGHTFCLNCLESTYFSCQQCPLCRQQIYDDSFSISTQMNKFVKFFTSKIMNNEERNSYEQREKSFNLNELKRALPLDLEVGSYVDYYLNNKWREAKVEQVQMLAFVLSIYDKSTKQTITVTASWKSRRLAKHRTFTIAPSLKPTYFSKNFNLSASVMQYIIEGPSYIARRPIHQPEDHSNNVQELARNSWDQFETIQNGNNWYFSENEDQLPRQSENMWNLYMENDLQSILLI